MLPVGTIDSLRHIGRPVGRDALATACPQALAYFGWHPAPPGAIVQACSSAPPAARCCPPSLPQRMHLAGAGLSFMVCCAGAAWAILPTTATNSDLEQAREWLHRVFPRQVSQCTIIQPAGAQAPQERPTWQMLHAELGPRPMIDRSHGGPSFARRPPNFQTHEKCGGSCGDSPVALTSCDPFVRAAFFAECIRPNTAAQFAETAWCADYAKTHGALGVRNCTNAAMGLGTPSGTIAKLAPPGALCREGKDCTG